MGGAPRAPAPRMREQQRPRALQRVQGAKRGCPGGQAGSGGAQGTPSPPSRGGGAAQARRAPAPHLRVHPTARGRRAPAGGRGRATAGGRNRGVRANGGQRQAHGTRSHTGHGCAPNPSPPGGRVARGLTGRTAGRLRARRRTTAEGQGTGRQQAAACAAGQRTNDTAQEQAGEGTWVSGTRRGAAGGAGAVVTGGSPAHPGGTERRPGAGGGAWGLGRRSCPCGAGRSKQQAAGAADDDARECSKDPPGRCGQARGIRPAAAAGVGGHEQGTATQQRSCRFEHAAGLGVVHRVWGGWKSRAKAAGAPGGTIQRRTRRL